MLNRTLNFKPIYKCLFSVRKCLIENHLLVYLVFQLQVTLLEILKIIKLHYETAINVYC